MIDPVKKNVSGWQVFELLKEIIASRRHTTVQL